MSAIPITSSPDFLRYQLGGAEAECARLAAELRETETRLEKLTDFLERADGPEEPAMSVGAMLSLDPGSSYARSIRCEIREAVRACREDDAADLRCPNCEGRRLDWIAGTSAARPAYKCQDCGCVTET